MASLGIAYRGWLSLKTLSSATSTTTFANRTSSPACSGASEQTEHVRHNSRSLSKTFPLLSINIGKQTLLWQMLAKLLVRFHIRVFYIIFGSTGYPALLSAELCHFSRAELSAWSLTHPHDHRLHLALASLRLLVLIFINDTVYNMQSPIQLFSAKRSKMAFNKVKRQIVSVTLARRNQYVLDGNNLQTTTDITYLGVIPNIRYGYGFPASVKE